MRSGQTFLTVLSRLMGLSEQLLQVDRVTFNSTACIISCNRLRTSMEPTQVLYICLLNLDSNCDCCHLTCIYLMIFEELKVE